MPGFDLEVLDENATPVSPGKSGTLAIKLPLPPGCFPTLWHADERFRRSYLSQFPGYYTTSDAGFRDADGYVYVMARTDDVINVAGHRLSTGQIEEVIAQHNDVAECAVIGVRDELKGQLPVGFVVLSTGVKRNHKDIEAEVVALVRYAIGPVAAFKTVMVVKRLPKTRSGKILRGTMRQIAYGEPYKVPATIDDPAVLNEITGVLQGRILPASAAALS
jgi:propionyl-CoA synthetase